MSKRTPEIPSPQAGETYDVSFDRMIKEGKSQLELNGVIIQFFFNFDTVFYKIIEDENQSLVQQAKIWLANKGIQETYSFY